MRKIFTFLILFCTLPFLSFSQTSKNSPCDTYITAEYIIDPQYHATPLQHGETKQFTITFIGGNVYRLAVSSSTENNIHFMIYDQESNMLFSNADFKYAPYWDFDVTNTLECTIKVSLVSPQTIEDFATICIGFKQ
ncbi:MAG: hypothetical protein M0R02_01520 [Bacteroidales bacterium]|jgi:hypothetical protein|nr:hypothetical protein [Bacteroidales bacterium]NLK80876.1 hypothetical protein [Bacteroidales bacterium]HPY82819.1 hypothetical protein [Bacteroidales bacterium]